MILIAGAVAFRTVLMVAIIAANTIARRIHEAVFGTFFLKTLVELTTISCESSRLAAACHFIIDYTAAAVVVAVVQTQRYLAEAACVNAVAGIAFAFCFVGLKVFDAYT